MSTPLTVQRGYTWQNTSTENVTSAKLNATGLPVVSVPAGAIGPDALNAAAVAATLKPLLTGVNLLPWGAFASDFWTGAGTVDVAAAVRTKACLGWEVLPTGAGVTARRYQAVPPESPVTAFGLQVVGAAGVTAVDLIAALEPQAANQMNGRWFTLSAWLWNQGSAPFTPQLSLHTREVVGQPAVAQVLAPAAASVAVPAGGWAKVSWSFDTSTLARWAFGGELRIRIPGSALDASVKSVLIAQAQLEVGQQATAWSVQAVAREQSLIEAALAGAVAATAAANATNATATAAAASAAASAAAASGAAAGAGRAMAQGVQTREVMRASAGVSTPLSQFQLSTVLSPGLPNLTVDLRPDGFYTGGAPTAVGQPVDEWRNMANSANHAVALSGIGRPIRGAFSGGGACASFNAGAERQGLKFQANTPMRHIFIVGQKAAATVASQYWTGTVMSRGGQRYGGFGFAHPLVLNPLWWSNGGQNLFGFSDYREHLPWSDRFVLSIKWTALGMVMSINGGGGMSGRVPFGEDTVHGSLLTTGLDRIGLYGVDTGQDDDYSGDLCRILAFDGILRPDREAALVNALMTEAGVTAYPPKKANVVIVGDSTQAEITLALEAAPASGVKTQYKIHNLSVGGSYFAQFASRNAWQYFDPFAERNILITQGYHNATPGSADKDYCLSQIADGWEVLIMTPTPVHPTWPNAPYGTQVGATPYMAPGGLYETIWSNVAATWPDFAHGMIAAHQITGVGPTWTSPKYRDQVHMTPEGKADYAAGVASAVLQRLVTPWRAGGNSTVTWNQVSNKPSTFPPVAHTHVWADITDPPALTVPDGAITAPKLAANAVTSAAIADNAVGSTEIAAGAVGATHLAANAVTGTAIASATIGHGKLIMPIVGNVSVTGTITASSTLIGTTLDLSGSLMILRGGTGAKVAWNGRGFIKSGSADGEFIWAGEGAQNGQAEANFVRVILGAATADFPAIKRTGAAVELRLGNDSARARLLAAGLNLSGLPTSASGLVTGDIWNDGGTLKIV